MKRTVGPAAPLVLLVLVTLAAGVSAQVFVEPADHEIVVRRGAATEIQETLTNPTARTYFVLATAAGNLSSDTRIEPGRFQLDPDDSVTVKITVQPPAKTEFEAGVMQLLFTVVDRQTGESFERVVRVSMTLEHEHLFLGLMENPLPPPLEKGWGMFAAELIVWATLSFLFASMVGLTLQQVIPDLTDDVKDRMAAQVKAPLWYLVFVLGLNFSWRLVPQTPLIEAFDRMNNAVAVIVAGVLAYRSVTAGLLHYAENVADKTETKVDDLLVPVFEKLGAALVVGVAAFYTFRVLGVDLSFLLAGGLVAGLVISMAAQDTLSNFFSGIFILIDRPFREGDELMIETGEITRVDKIGLRSTKLYHFQNHQQMILPNNELATKRVINMSYPDRTYRLVIKVGVAYDTDLNKAVKVILDAVKDHPEVLSDPRHEPTVYVKEYGDSSINLEIRLFVPSSRRRNPVGTDLRISIKKAFDANGIEIPFPQRVVWFHPNGKQVDIAVGEGVRAPKLAEGEVVGIAADTDDTAHTEDPEGATDEDDDVRSAPAPAHDEDERPAVQRSEAAKKGDAPPEERAPLDEEGEDKPPPPDDRDQRQNDQR